MYDASLLLLFLLPPPAPMRLVLSWFFLVRGSFPCHCCLDRGQALGFCKVPGGDLDCNRSYRNKVELQWVEIELNWIEKLVWSRSIRNTQKNNRLVPSSRKSQMTEDPSASTWHEEWSSSEDLCRTFMIQCSLHLLFWWDVVLMCRSCWAWLAHYSSMSAIFPLTWCCFAAAAGSTRLHFLTWWSHVSFWGFTPAVLRQQRPVKQMFLSNWWTEKWFNQLKVLNEFISQCQLLTGRVCFKVLWSFKLYS